MNRFMATAGVLLIAFLGVLATGTAVSLTATPTRADQLALTPCPGPQPTATPYAPRPKDTAFQFGASRSSVPQPGTACGPPPPGPFASPKLCGLKFAGFAAEYSVVTCAPIPPPHCGTRAANALDIQGTNLDLLAPGYRIFEVNPSNGQFVLVSAVKGSGGEYEFVSGGSPVSLVGTGTCVRIPLPHTGGYPAAPQPTPFQVWPWLAIVGASVVAGSLLLLRVVWPGLAGVDV